MLSHGPLREIRRALCLAMLTMATSSCDTENGGVPAVQRVFDTTATPYPSGLFSEGVLSQNILVEDFESPIARTTDEETGWMASEKLESTPNSGILNLAPNQWILRIAQVPKGWTYQAWIEMEGDSSPQHCALIPLFADDLKAIKSGDWQVDQLPFHEAQFFRPSQGKGQDRPRAWAEVEFAASFEALGILCRAPADRPLSLRWIRVARKNRPYDQSQPPRVSLGDEERWIEAFDGNSWKRELRCGGRAPRFKTGLAFRHPSPPKTIQVQLNVEGEAVFESSMSTFQTASIASWQEINVSLEKWKGKSVEVHLKIDGLSKGQANHPDAVGLLGSPLILDSSPSDTQARPNILLLSIDTLRADRLGVYGYHRPTSPFLDSLAEKATVIERCYSTSGYTLPAHASLFSGQYPMSHGANDGFTPMHPEVSPSLTSSLAEQGYVTLATTSAGFLAPFFGFSRGFDAYTSKDPFSASTEPDQITPGLQAFAQQLQDLHGAPFFAFLHTFTVHDYRASIDDIRKLGIPTHDDPATYQESYVSLIQQHVDDYRNADPNDIQNLSDLYDASIRVMDKSLEFLFDALEDAGLLENTWVIVTSDHGEEFYEHGGLLHGHSVHEEVTRIPAMVLGPGFKQGYRATGPFSLADWSPTLAEALQFELDPRIDGVSMWDHLQGHGAGHHEILSEIDYSGYTQMAIHQGSFRAMRKGLGKNSDVRVLRLYDKEVDVGEQRDISTRWPMALKDLVETMDERRDLQRESYSTRLPPNTEFDALPDDLQKNLSDLGYRGNRDREPNAKEEESQSGDDQGGPK